MQKTLKLKLYKKYLIRKHYKNVKINGIIFIMKNFTCQKFGLFLKGWTPMTLFMLKVDLEK